MNFNSEQMTRVAISILINEWESLFGSFRGPQVSAGSDKLRAFVTIYDFLITQKYFKTPGRKSCGSKWIGILWQSFHSYQDWIKINALNKQEALSLVFSSKTSARDKI